MVVRDSRSKSLHWYADTCVEAYRVHYSVLGIREDVKIVSARKPNYLSQKDQNHLATITPSKQDISLVHLTTPNSPPLKEARTCSSQSDPISCLQDG